MSISRDHLYNLLPGVYRERDAAGGGVLRQYLEVLTDELAVVADGIDQLYDDLFVETAEVSVLPYIADLIGLRGLPGASTGGLTPRAEVANTIAYRRRKGTAAVLEQVARDTTGWPARAVEYFELVTACQHMNHVRLRNQATVSVRGPGRLEFVGTAFERGTGLGLAPDLIHLPEMRRIPPRRGRYNLPNVGIFLWRLRAYPMTRFPALPIVAGEEHRFLLNPLGATVQLFTLPVTEDEITHLAEPLNVPMPLSRRWMSNHLAALYGPGLSLNIAGVDLADVSVCDLRDIPGGAWAHTPAPAGRVLVDPVLGRMAVGDPATAAPLVSYHYGFSADLGGGEYDRVSTFATSDGRLESVAQDGTAGHSGIGAALGTVGSGGGTVEILDSGRYPENLTVAATSAAIEIRAADGRRPTVVLGADLPVTLSDDAEVSLNGLVITGAMVRVSGKGRLVLRHCTLVPGIGVDADGAPIQPGTPSLIVESGECAVTLERCIVGGIRMHVDAELTCTDSVIDAGETGIALASAPDGSGPGGTVTFDACTVLGRIRTRILQRASNSIFLAVVPAGEEPEWPGPVLVAQRQRGCVRFCYLPAGSRSPRRYRCVPSADADAAELRPVLTSGRYGDPAYGQLDRRTPDVVLRGADDESEMGALHHLQQPRREAYLQARLQDYLRFGLEAGLFFAT